MPQVRRKNKTAESGPALGLLLPILPATINRVRPGLTQPKMPARKETFVTNEIYHLIVRAIDDNLIFKDINDYFRGIFSIYEFNNANPVNIFVRRRNRTVEKKEKNRVRPGLTRF